MLGSNYLMLVLFMLIKLNQQDYKAAIKYGKIAISYVSTEDEKVSPLYTLGASYYHLVYIFYL